MCSFYREGVDQIVIGLPLRKKAIKNQGLENTQTVIVRKFASILVRIISERVSTKFRVFLFDERFSSKMAKAMGGGGELLDGESAGVILESFYSRCGVSGGLGVANLEEMKIPFPEFFGDVDVGKGDEMQEITGSVDESRHEKNYMMSRKERREMMMKKDT